MLMIFQMLAHFVIHVIQVGDFGLSKIKRNTLVSGGVRGTLPWMAPELLNGSSNKVSEKVTMFLFLHSVSIMNRKCHLLHLDCLELTLKYTSLNNVNFSSASKCRKFLFLWY